MSPKALFLYQQELGMEIIQELRFQGAEAVILGCTEISLLVEQRHTNVILYDTTAIHVSKAVQFALSD